MYLKKTLVLLSFLCCYTIVSQESSIKNHSYFFKKVDSLNSVFPLLKAANIFFKHKQWDSVIVNSSKVLIDSSSAQYSNYFRYMRGHSFMKKNLFKQAQKEFEKISTDFFFYDKVLYTLSGVSLEQKNYKKALSYLKKIENKEYSRINELDKISIINDIGVCYIHLKDYKNAEIYLSNFLNSVRKKNNTQEIIEAYTNIANLYYEQYKDDLAIPYFERAYLLSRKTINYEIKRKTSKNMAIVEENRKDIVKALVYRKEYDKWKDSLNNQDEIWKTAQFEKKLALNQKQKEINILASENKIKALQRNGFILTSILLSFILFGGMYLYFQQKKSHKIIASQKEELNALNNTKDKLFSIVSHDLRSSVNLLQKSNSKLLYEIQNRNYDALGSIVTKNATIANSSYNLLENLLHWATIQTKQLYFYIESVDLFSVMQQIAFNYQPLFENKEIIFKNKITPASFILADLDSLKIIIRNLLDNSIKFNKVEGFISVYNYPKGTKHECFVVEDSGIGMSAEIIKELLKKTSLLSKKNNQEDIGTGLGIQLCKTLILKNHATLEIESTINKGTKMIITFPKSI
ncbi:tetratricopeptide repeat-containing sensor histidine kinase [Tenacibaculum ovolyticum]|uniref:tetratricopeptide repeat-containing sensor histidine kinase n=1 Tax=Tenacibaculum ovolyticum TaxID=104270 RepID=UPI001F190FC4|nr:ATP-binding protein [Tenacibaculum ovolyticum]